MTDNKPERPGSVTDVAFEGLPQEAEILAEWQGGSGPTVSIACIAYNHRPFIEDTLRGFLRQRTRYRYHIVCYDDCSSDGTRAVLQAYQERYPKLIELILPSDNQRSQGKRPYLDFIHCRMTGDYIARCEGDDYWSDPEKLQQQVDFLEQNPAYVLATHDIQTIDADGNLVSATHLPDYYRRNFSARELMQGWAGPVTQAVVFRNVLKAFPREIYNVQLGDVFLASLLGQYGGSAYLSGIQPSMYRLHAGGIFSSLSDSDRTDVQADSFFWLHKYYKRIGRDGEARVFKLKMLEKHVRDTGARDWLAIGLVRFFGGNLKKQIERLVR